MAPPTRRGKKGKKPEKIVVSEEDKQPGAVYIGHVPHGFFEDQMRAYFSQFGDVLRVKLARSKKTGNSKGYAFIKFRYSAVARTVAETCHNYLFFNRLLKCSYKAMDELHKDTFKSHPKIPIHKEQQQHNAEKSEENLQRSTKRAAGKLTKKMKLLSDAGINITLDDIMSTPQDNKSAVAKAKQAVPVKTKSPQGKTPKGKKRGRADSDGVQASQTKPDKSVDNGDDTEEITSPTPKKRKGLASEEITSPTPKRRKGLASGASKTKLGNEEIIQVQPSRKLRSASGPKAVVAAKTKTVKDVPSGKKAAGQKSPKTSKGKVVVPAGVKKSGPGKRKK